MICRKISYQLPSHLLPPQSSQTWKDFMAGLFTVVRTIDVRGEVQCQQLVHEGKVVIDFILEGDASQIKLLQHKVERFFKSEGISIAPATFEKTVNSAPYGHYPSLLMLAN